MITLVLPGCQPSGETAPLTQGLRLRPARIVRAVENVDRPQDTLDAPANVVQFVFWPRCLWAVALSRLRDVGRGGLAHDVCGIGRNPEALADKLVGLMGHSREIVGVAGIKRAQRRVTERDTEAD